MDILPDCVQYAGCNALSSGQTEDPDPTDATQRLFRDSGAAPGSVPLHEVVFRHVFESIWLLQDSVSLEGQKVVQSVTTPLYSLRQREYVTANKLREQSEVSLEGFLSACFLDHTLVKFLCLATSVLWLSRIHLNIK